MLRDAVLAAVGRSDVREEVLRIYRELQEQIDLRKPKCSTSGRCCRFEEYGHRLYVTTLELATFFALVGDPERSDAACPFQMDGLCSVHAARPFGCRVFFCDSTSDQWQHEQYERFHGELKRLHVELGVEYHYVEWRAGLAEIGVSAPSGCETASGNRDGAGGTRRVSLAQVRF